MITDLNYWNSPEGVKEREDRLKLLNICGVYVIQNKVNYNKYIGSSINVNKRFTQHKSKLRTNSHPNFHLQNAWNKYGEENFEFVKITSEDYIENLRKNENRYIKLYNPEYNNVKVNKEGIIFFSDETKRKIGEKSKQKFINNPDLIKKLINSRKGKQVWNKNKKGIYTKETLKLLSEKAKEENRIKISINNLKKVKNTTYKAILQYDKNMNFIKEWNSIKEACNFYNISCSNLSIAHKKGIKIKNSYWKLKV